MSTSTPLDLYPLPYTTPKPPEELYFDIASGSGGSGTMTFKTAIDARDVFLGHRRCVICGNDVQAALQYCPIIGRSDIEAWELLRRLKWVPEAIKQKPGYEPRNGLLMCANHRLEFEARRFFIRFQPTTGKYILVYYNSYQDSLFSNLTAHLHGKAIALDIKDKHAPLPTLFLVHEYMVRGRNFYQPTPVEICNSWQDWIVNDGVVNEGDEQSFSFKRDAPGGPPSLPL